MWDYLTDPDLFSEWLGSGQIACEVGGKVELRSGGPVIRGKVAACERPHLLSLIQLAGLSCPGIPIPGRR